jgi:type VI secretion system protein VasD
MHYLANMWHALPLLSALLILGTACRSAPPATACTLPTKMRLEAGERINLDPEGQALPTVVRLYQTKEIIRVEEADFADVWEKPEETLGPDLVKVQQFTLFPGKSETAAVSLGPDTRYVVGVAIFRLPTGTQWRSIIPLPAAEKMCAAYSESGAPDPAIVFRFDNYRVEAKSRLLTAGGEHELPTDVAPDAPGDAKKD